MSKRGSLDEISITNEPLKKKQKITFDNNNINTLIEYRNKGFKEEELRGIKIFLGDQEKWFSGLIKERFEDFIVHEVDINGNIIQLSSYKLLDINSFNKKEEETKNPISIEKELESIIGEDQTSKLLKFKNETPENDKKNVSFSIPAITDKEKRKLIHGCIRKLEGLRSTTDNGSIIVEFFERKSKTYSQFRDRDVWPKDIPSYLQFSLYKSNEDTSKCVHGLCRSLRMKSSSFGFAGTKDKRAKTTQLFTAFKLKPQKLVSAVKEMRNIAVGDFKLVDKAIKLGDLFGNRFSIVIRDVIGDINAINSSLNHVKEHGFINYFGMQRFGTGKVPSNSVGLAILQSKWKEAIDLILSPNNRTDTKEALEHFKKTGDAQSTKKMLKRTCIEFKILNGLQSNSNGYYNALSNLPRTMRTLYVHAYQSYIWNEVVTQRIKKYGLTLIEGDLVLTEEQPLLHNEDIEIVDDNDMDLLTKQNIAIISKSDIENNKYSIYDVVLPLPGYSITLPKNDIGDLFKELLTKDNLDISLKHKSREYSLSGAYRKIIQKPIDLEWDIVKYNNNELPLFLSDIDILEGKTLPEEEKEGEFTAIKLSMTLHRSTYATMCIREMMKYPTHYQ